MAIQARHLVFFDLLSLALSIAPGVVSWTAVISFGLQISSKKLLFAYLIASPLLLAFSFILTLALFRQLIPKLTAGVTEIGMNRKTIAWYCHLALNRSLKVSGLRYLLNVSYFLKYLTYRALGAQIELGVHTPMEFTLVDLPLIQIGAGTTIGENVHISCHYFMGDRLLLKPIKIGKGCFLGMDSVVGPGSQLGDGVRVGFGNIVSGDRLADQDVVCDGEWREGSPRRAALAKQTQSRQNKELRVARG